MSWQACVDLKAPKNLWPREHQRHWRNHARGGKHLKGRGQPIKHCGEVPNKETEWTQRMPRHGHFAWSIANDKAARKALHRGQDARGKPAARDDGKAFVPRLRAVGSAARPGWGGRHRHPRCNQSPPFRLRQWKQQRTGTA